MGIVFDPERYTHESDRAALKALKAVPGFSALMKKTLQRAGEHLDAIRAGLAQAAQTIAGV